MIMAPPISHSAPFDSNESLPSQTSHPSKTQLKVHSCFYPSGVGGSSVFVLLSLVNKETALGP